MGMVGKLYKVDSKKTTIKNTVYLTKPVIISLSKVAFGNSLDNATNIKNVSFAISGYYVGSQGVIEIGDKLEVNGRTYEIKTVNSAINAMRKTLFNNYFEGV